MSGPRAVVFVGATLLLTAPGAPAPAQSVAEEAKAHAARAREAVAKKRWAEAAAAFEAAWRASKRPELQLELAAACEKRRDLPAAIQALGRYLEDDSVIDTEEVRDKLTRLEKGIHRRLGKLALRTAPAGASLRLVMGKTTIEDRTPWTRWLPPGRWELTVEHPGHLAETRVITLTKGGVMELSVSLALVE